MKKRLFALTMAALILLCASCAPAAETTPTPTPTMEVTPTPTATPTPTPELTPTPSPTPMSLEEELYTLVKDYFDLRRDTVNGVEIPSSLANSYQRGEAAARAEAMRAYWEEWGVHIVSLETELKDFQMRRVRDDSAVVSVYEWTWVNYNGTGKDDPATDRMGWGYTHEVTLMRWGQGTYDVATDRSDEFKETNYKSGLCMVSENHDWSGSGYSYTSEAMGVRVEFPPEWAELMTMVEGKWTYEGEKRPCIDLMGSWDSEDPFSCIGTIFWKPKTDAYSVFEDDGWTITLAETNEGKYICFLEGMNRLRWSYYEEEAPYYPERDNAFITVQDGITVGEWEIEILEPTA